MLGWLMSLAIVRTECFDGCFFFSPHFSVGFLMSSSKGHLHSSIQRNEHETALAAFGVSSKSSGVSGSRGCGNRIRSMLHLKNHPLLTSVCLSLTIYNINITLPTVCMFLNILQVKVGI